MSKHQHDYLLIGLQWYLSKLGGKRKSKGTIKGVKDLRTKMGV